MGKFMLKETKRELGISPWNSTCSIGARVGGKYRFGNIAVVFDGIMSAVTYINNEVLRKALLENPDKTARLLGIEVKDLQEIPVEETVEVKDEKTKKEEVLVNDSPTDIETTIDKEVETIIEEDSDSEPEVIEPEEVSPEEFIEEDTEEFEMTVELPENPKELTPGVDLVNMKKAELIEYGKEHGIELSMELKKDDMIAKIAKTIEEME
jgi:hypothetical protein